MSADEAEDPAAPAPAISPVNARTSDAATGTASTPPASAPGRYEIIGEHGRGGLGRVSRARDRELGRDVAIKELISRGTVSEARFLREALITARLEHPGIVPVHEAGRWPDGTPYYAMKLVAGRPLRALIAERHTVAERIGLLHHVIAVADALAYAHGCHIIHRDLKPANVIVGEFGETVVIDWGLAKDLSASDGAPDTRSVDSALVDGAARSRVTPELETPGRTGDLLTKTGIVLGTPAYMAPEQERGEAVDQRADVFAIGAMLWELCALTKVPPTDRRHRHRLLRHNGIDPDLITILDKCLAPEPARRYPDAAALAADLKAFKAGARISARSYTLPAMLGHWTRRHRRLALAVVAIISVAVIGVAAYARSLAVGQRRAERSNQRLVLENARALMARDPTAAHELLESYRGDDVATLAVLRAEAIGRGTAIWSLRPDMSRIAMIYPVNGALVRVHTNGKLSKVFPNGVVHDLSAERASPLFLEYAQSSHLLAYRCASARLCLFSLADETSLPPGAWPPGSIVDVSASPSGRALAVLSNAGLVVWRVSAHGIGDELWRSSLSEGDAVSFADDDTVWVSSSDHGWLLHLDGHPRISRISGLPTTDAPSPGVSHMISVGLSSGALLRIDRGSDVVLRAMRACSREMLFVSQLADADAVAFRCRGSSAVSLWSPQRQVIRTLSNTVERSGYSADGRYLYMGTNDGEVLVYDARSDSMRALRAYTRSVMAIMPPSADYPYLVTDDESGDVRAWSLDDSPVIASLPGEGDPSYSLLALPGGAMALPQPGRIQWHAADGRHASFAYPDGAVYYASSSTRARLASYGSDDEMSVLSLEPVPLAHSFRTGHGRHVHAYFSVDGVTVIAVSADGTISRWSLDGASHATLATLPEMPIGVHVCPSTDRAIVTAASWRQWLLDQGQIRYLGTSPEDVVMVGCAPGGAWYADATADGTVYVFDVDTGRRFPVLRGTDPITAIGFSPDGQELAVATDHRLFLRSLSALKQEAEDDPVAVRYLDGADVELVRPQRLTYSPDSRWLVVAADRGALWFFERKEARWVFLSVGPARIMNCRFTSDSRRFFAKDAAGITYIVDMNANSFH